MKGSPSSLSLFLFSPPLDNLFSWPSRGGGEVEYFVDGLNGRNGSGVNGNPRDRAKDYLEGGGRQRLGKS